MRIVRRAWTGALSAVLVLGLASTAALAQGTPSPSPSPTKQNVTFTVGVNGDLNSINPFKQIDATESWMYGLMYDGLLRYKQQAYEPEGELAQSWEVSSDGLTWTFHLRAGPTWSDGVPITANDVVWTANFILENRTRASSWIDGYRAVQSITAPDNSTVVWRTTKPTVVPGLPGYSLILPEHVWSRMTPREVFEDPFFPTVVSGPFNIVERHIGESWRMAARSDYWQGAPQIDDIVFRVYNSNEAVIQALLKGAVDYASVPTVDLFDSIKDRPGIGTAVDAAEAFYQLSFNLADDPSSTANPAVLDPQFRQAVEFAIDRETLVQRIARGYATPGSTPIAPVYPYWHWQPPDGEAIGYDPAKANEILDAAGYRDTNGDGIRELPGGGTPLKLRLFDAVGDSDGLRAAPFIRGWLKDVGIQVSIRSMTDSQLYHLWYAFDWDLIIYSWGTGPDPDFLLSTFTAHECGYWSDTCYHNPQYDELYLQQQTTVDRRARQSIVHQMQQILYQDVPEIVLWYPNTFEAWRSDRWAGFVRWPEPDGVAFWGNTFSARFVHPKAGGGTVRVESGPSGFMWLILIALIAFGIAASTVRRRRLDEYYA